MSLPIRKWRQELNLSQRKAAAALGVDLTTLQRLERGAQFGTDKPVQVDKRTRLAMAAIRAGLEPEPLD